MCSNQLTMECTLRREATLFDAAMNMREHGLTKTSLKTASEPKAVGSRHIFCVTRAAESHILRP